MCIYTRTLCVLEDLQTPHPHNHHQCRVLLPLARTAQGTKTHAMQKGDGCWGSSFEMRTFCRYLVASAEAVEVKRDFKRGRNNSKPMNF